MYCLLISLARILQEDPIARLAAVASWEQIEKLLIQHSFVRAAYPSGVLQ
jgi:hypothetical protein